MVKTLWLVGRTIRGGLAHPHLVRHPGQHPTNQLKQFYIKDKVAPILGHFSRYHQVFDGFLMGNYPESFDNSFRLIIISCPYPWQHPTNKLPPFYISSKVGLTAFCRIQWVSYMGSNPKSVINSIVLSFEYQGLSFKGIVTAGQQPQNSQL